MQITLLNVSDKNILRSLRLWPYVGGPWTTSFASIVVLKYICLKLDQKYCTGKMILIIHCTRENLLCITYEIWNSCTHIFSAQLHEHSLKTEMFSYVNRYQIRGINFYEYKVHINNFLYFFYFAVDFTPFSVKICTFSL